MTPTQRSGLYGGGLGQCPEQPEHQSQAQGTERELDGHQRASGKRRAESEEINIHEQGRLCLGTTGTRRALWPIGMPAIGAGQRMLNGKYLSLIFL